MAAVEGPAPRRARRAASLFLALTTATATSAYADNADADDDDRSREVGAVVIASAAPVTLEDVTVVDEGHSASRVRGDEYVLVADGRHDELDGLGPRLWAWLLDAIGSPGVWIADGARLTFDWSAPGGASRLTVRQVW